jgi:hypothetical protein
MTDKVDPVILALAEEMAAYRAELERAWRNASAVSVVRDAAPAIVNHARPKSNLGEKVRRLVMDLLRNGPPALGHRRP